jgi:hypothetical protein
LEAADEELRRDQAEAVRVAYVAATRARNLLVAPVCGDEPIEGWIDVLKPVLYPTEDSRRNSDRADGCPSFRSDMRLRPFGLALPPTAIRDFGELPNRCRRFNDIKSRHVVRTQAIRESQFQTLV